MDRQRQSIQKASANAREKALWLLERLVPGTGVNVLAVAFQVDGHLRPDILRSSIATVTDRNEVLRTVFSGVGPALAKEVIPSSGFAVEVEDIDLPDGEVEEELRRYVRRPFDFNGRPLIRAALASRQEGDICCIVFHHLVCDATSMGIFMGQLIAAYDSLLAGRVLPRVETAAAGPGEPKPLEADVVYWRQVLDGYVPEGLDLWCGSRRAENPLMSGGTVTYEVSAEGRDAIQRLQREVRAPVTAILLAAYYALLVSHGAGPDLVIGSPLDVRGQHSRAIGYHITVVPLRLRVDLAESFRELTRRARNAFLAAMAHGSASVDDLSADLHRDGSSWSTTLYRHAFNCLPGISVDDVRIGGMNAKVLELENGFSKWDLELIALPSKSEILFRYAAEILDRADVEALMRRYEALLIAAVQAPDRPVGELVGWSSPDRGIIDAANQTARQADEASVVAVFRSRVLAAPEAPAVTDGGRTFTYRQVWDAAAGVRDLLLASGAGRADVVGLAVREGHEGIAAILGTWLAEAAYLPLDPGQDISSLARRLAGSPVKLILVGDGVRPPAGDGVPPALSLSSAVSGTGTLDKPVPALNPLAAACAFAANGPSGSAAVTELSHRAVANLVSHFAAELAMEPGSGALALADFWSVGSLLELFVPLVSGGQVVVPPGGLTNAGVLHETLARHDVRVMQLPPGFPARILEEGGDALGQLHVVARGEEVPPRVARRLLSAGVQLHSVYDAEGTAGWAISGRGSGLTGGRPIANTRAFVIAPDGRELPPGVRGELCIAGDALALRCPDDSRFADHPRYGRYYRTGTLARWSHDGRIERLGEIGRQVLVGGVRVNLDEVEAVLLDCQGVNSVAAVVVTTPDEGEALVIFAETDGIQEPDGQLAQQLLDLTAVRLPPAAVPQCVMCIAALPRALGGLVDHDALRVLAGEGLSGSSRQPESAANDLLARHLTELWNELLGAEVTPQTSFFTAGGHSLLAAVLAQRIENLTGVAVELPDVFEHPTPAAMAARISEKLKRSTSSQG